MSQGFRQNWRIRSKDRILLPTPRLQFSFLGGIPIIPQGVVHCCLCVLPEISLHVFIFELTTDAFQTIVAILLLKPGHGTRRGSGTPSLPWRGKRCPPTRASQGGDFSQGQQPQAKGRRVHGWVSAHSGSLASLLLSERIAVFSFVASGCLFLFKGIIRWSARLKERCASDRQLPLPYLGHKLRGFPSLRVPREAGALSRVFLAGSRTRCYMSVSSMNLWLGGREGFCQSALCSPSFLIFMTAVHVKIKIQGSLKNPSSSPIRPDQMLEYALICWFSS